MSTKRKAESAPAKKEPRKKEPKSKGRKVQFTAADENFTEDREVDENELNVPQGEEEFDEKEDFTGGYKFEPFNMSEEREEGRFDDAGTYREKSYMSRRNNNNEAFLRGEKIKKKLNEILTKMNLMKMTMLLMHG